MIAGQSKGIAITVIAALAMTSSAALFLAALTVEQYGPGLIDRLRQGFAAGKQALGHPDAPSAPALPDLPPRPVPAPDRSLAGRGVRGNPGTAFGDDAYPPDAIRAGEQGRTTALLRIDASGTPISCAIKTSSGSPSLDAATCSIALRRARFDPAREAQGKAISSTYTLPVRWVLPDDS